MNPELRNHLDEYAAKHRLENFRISIEPVEWRDGEVSVCITRNGKQWESVTVNERERLLLIEALTSHGPCNSPKP